MCDALERICRAGGWLRGLRAEHFLLRLRAKAAWRGAHECVLRGLSLYRGAVIAADFPHAAARYVFCCAGLYDRGRVALRQG